MRIFDANKLTETEIQTRGLERSLFLADHSWCDELAERLGYKQAKKRGWVDTYYPDFDYDLAHNTVEFALEAVNKKLRQLKVPVEFQSIDLVEQMAWIVTEPRETPRKWAKRIFK
jgi:hypothetical protein